jgi:hypothetical protein
MGTFESSVRSSSLNNINSQSNISAESNSGVIEVINSGESASDEADILSRELPDGQLVDDELLYEDEEDDDDMLGDEEDEDEDIGLDQSNFNGDYSALDQSGAMSMRHYNGYNSSCDGTSSNNNMLLMFKCRVCGKAFKHRRSLNRHVKLHSGEKNFKCPYCSTAFARSDHLKAHIRTHNNSKPYRCSVCQCGYSTQAALKVHIAHHHTRSKFKCALCDNMEFHSQLALEGHMYTKHSKENNVADMSELINETTTIHPTLMSAEEVANSSVNGSINHNSSHVLANSNVNSNDSYQANNSQTQRSRLIDINNYNNSSHINDVSLNNGLRNGFVKPNTDRNSSFGVINNGMSNQNERYEHEEEDSEPKRRNQDEPRGHEGTGNENRNNNSDAAMSNGDYSEQTNETTQNGYQNEGNDDDDDVIIEEDLSNVSIRAPFVPEMSRPRPPPAPHNGHVPSQHGAYQTHRPYNSHPTSHMQHIAPKPVQHPHAHGPPPSHFYGPAPPHLYNGALPAGPMHQNHPHHHAQPPPHFQNNSNRPVPPPPAINHHHNTHHIPNTYCELCNARFSNVESYSAHMRNSHPNIHHNHPQHHQPHPHAQSQMQQQSGLPAPPHKMPYLSSILNGNGGPNPPMNSKMVQPGQIIPGKQMMTPVVRSTGAIITAGSAQIPPPLPAPAAPSQTSGAICNVPSCNCSMKQQTVNINPIYLNRQQPPQQQRTILNNSQNMSDYFFDDYHIVKDTHYTCVQCQLTVHKLSDYMQHLKQEHCVEVYRCVLCKQMQLFDNLNLLKEHFFMQHQSHKYDVFKCKICLQQSDPATHNHHKGFVYVEDLCLHLKSVHNKIVDVNRLRQHCGNNNPMNAASTSNAPPPPSMSQQSTLPVPPTTSAASAQFHNNSAAGLPGNSVSSSANHYPHAPPPPPPPVMPMKCFKCTFCDSDFAQPAALTQHIQMVHQQQQSNPQQQQQQQQQQFSCQYCRNTFTQRAQLERHMRIHLTSIDLKCNICDLKFATHDLLNEHKLVHSKTLTSDNLQAPAMNAMPSSSQSTVAATASLTSSAVCAYCKQNLQNEQQFKEHFKRHNNIGQPQPPGVARPTSYMCIVCRQTLTSNQEYSLHMRHHLRPRQPQPQQQSTSNTSANSSLNEPSAKPTPTFQTPPKQVEATQNTSNANSEACHKFLLRCGKCPVKFEYGQEYVEHMRKFHPEESKNMECMASSNSNGSTSRSSSTSSSLTNSNKSQVSSAPSTSSNQTNNTNNLKPTGSNSTVPTVKAERQSPPSIVASLLQQPQNPPQSLNKPVPPQDQESPKVKNRSIS